MVKPGSDAAVFFVRYANKILAATTDCNSLYCALDPREGGKIAVAEAARNLTCSGARPLAVTDCLNFGNPYKPENFWQLREAVEGVAEACRAFGTPVTGGNVSLYNESPLGVVDPTPTIAMVGLIDDEKHITTQWFKNEGDVIILVGSVAGGGDPGCEATGHTKKTEVNALGYSLGGSRYLKVCHGLKIGPTPQVDLAHEIKVQNAVRDLIREGLVQSAHDCSEGGLAVTLAESCFNPKRLFGAEISVTRASGLREKESAWWPCAAKKIASETHALHYLTNRSRALLSRSHLKISRRRFRFYASMTFHFSNWGKSAATNWKLRSTNKPSAGELPRFTTSGGTRFVAQLNKTKAFRACESLKGAIESPPI